MARGGKAAAKTADPKARAGAGIAGEIEDLARLVQEILPRELDGSLPPDRRDGSGLDGGRRGDGRAAPIRASERVLGQIIEMIRSGDPAPGGRLPPERELARTLGVGRNSLREAIRQLALLGLVEARQGGGTYVLEPNAASLVQPFSRVVELGAAEPRDIMEFRLMFEPFVAGLAAQRLTRAPARLLEIESALHAVEASGENDPEAAIEFDTLFHHQIAEAAGNPVVVAVEQALLEFLHKVRVEAVARESYRPIHAAAAGHRRIFARLREGDGLGAAQAMREHLEEVSKMIRR